MSKGYVIVTEEISDQARFDAYSRSAVPTVMQYGGNPIIVNDDVEVLEGQWHGSRTLVIEFESVAAAKTWYQSAEYQSVVGERHASADSNLVIVGGFEMPR